MDIMNFGIQNEKKLIQQFLDQILLILNSKKKISDLE